MTEMQFDSVASVTNQKDKADLYKEYLNKLLSQPNQPLCCEFIDHMLMTDVPLVISRPLLLIFVNSLGKLPEDLQKPVAMHALEKMQAREVSFDEQRTALREFVAALFEGEEDWSGAAKMLAAVDYERTIANLSVRQKLERYIKITMLFLEDDNAVDAERFFVKASGLIGQVEDVGLEMQYKACYARISDSKRRFLEAATRYYELSQVTSIQSEESINNTLQAAVTCAILHPASTHRSRMLAMLYKDERVSDPAAVPQFPFLEKMLMERLITKEDVAAFDSMLKEHQRALLPDGFTVLESAVVQHNIRSVSNMYHNISIPQLASLLGLSEEKVESLACDMISEGRLKGYIDQVDNIIVFEDDMGPLAQWDEHITSACEAVDKIIDVILLDKSPV